MKSRTLFKAVLIMFVIAVLIPGFAQAKKDQPKLKVVKSMEKGKVIGGTLVQWKDIATFEKGLKKDKKNKPVGNIRTIKKLKKAGEDRDPVVQTTDGSGGLVKGSKALTGGASFNGMNQASHGAGWPPDVNGDVGRSNVSGNGYYIQTVNTSIGIYNKATGALVSATTFNSFFPASVGAPCDNSNKGDPIVLYDYVNDRWFILDFSWSGSCTPPFYYAIAASQTNDPTGGWWTYCMLADTTNMNDYPKCGIWNDAIWITANMFPSCSSFAGAKVHAVKIPDLYTGTLTTAGLFLPSGSNPQAASLLPSHIKGSTVPSGSPNFMFAMDADEFGGGSIDALYMWKASVNWGTTTITMVGPQTMPTAAFGLTASRIAQPCTSNTLDSLYGRLMYPANYWNYGSHESVVLCHVAEYSSRRAMRWYEVRIDGSDNGSIYQQGTYSPDSNSRWMGSIAMNEAGDIGMGYSIGSSSMAPSLAAAGRCVTDPLNTLPQGETILHAGTQGQTSYTRWGDYSSTFVDPDDLETFWFTHEYLTSCSTNWLTRIVSFTIGCGGPPVCTLNDALDNATLTFSTSGDGLFACEQTTGACDGVDWAKSGTISHNQTSSFEFTRTFTADEAVQFDWSVSSEANYDYLRVYIDGVEQDAISGTVACTAKSLCPGAGTHTIKWSYTKDGSVSTGTDAGWVDNVRIVPGVCSIGTCPSGYCASQGNNYSYEYIARVQVDGIDNSSAGSNYTDYTGSVSGTVTRGNNYSVTLTPGFPGSSYTEYWTIWIDYNQDGDFTDAGEQVFSGSGSSVVSGSFTVPSGASTGCTRMRVSMKYGSASTSCETFTYGEVEDYKLTIN